MPDDSSRFCGPTDAAQIAGARPWQPDRLRPLRQGQYAPDALLEVVQGPLLRAQGPPAARVAGVRRESVVGPGAPGRATGFCATDRPVRVNRNTVLHLGHIAGGHARRLHDEPGKFSP